MSVIVVATILPIPEHRDEVIATFESVIAKVHAEDAGCELYALHEGEDRLVMVEKWASADDLNAHNHGAALRDLVAGLDGKLSAAPDIRVLTPHPAGTAEQGVV